MQNGKTALITGSTSGIGLGIAESFAKSGYNLCFNGLEQNGAEIAAEMGAKIRHSDHVLRSQFTQTRSY